MSTSVMPNDSALRKSDRAQSASVPFTILKALGSLKITVVMFSLALLIVLVGTLAQDEMDLAGVKREFFNCWVARVPFDVFFPITLMPHDEPYFGGFGIYLPGGATIGLILLVNLIAAKVTRFSVSAKGTRLVAGSLVTLLGAGLITAVIMSGHAADGLQGKPPVSYEALWGILKGGFAVLTLALAAYLILGKMPPLNRIFLGVATAISVMLTAAILLGGEAVRLDDPGLRIVWQLVQASIASCVTLAGLWMVFGKRGGNVLIHAGVGLLMVGQFVFGDRQVEQRMGLAEGATTNLAVIEDEIEVALIDTSDPDDDTVYAIPEAIVRNVAGTDKVIDDPALPVKLKVLDYYKNSRLVPLKEDESTLATAGLGLERKAERLKPFGAAVMDKVNVAAAYVEVLDRDSEKSLGTYLLSQEENDLSQMYAALLQDNREQVTIDGKPFELAIRYRQVRKPFEVLLKDVERINYTGTETPRDYSSRIVITDAAGESVEGKTWMNNPIRYQGETFYQSRYNKIPLGNGETIETTGLQVVRNAGWVIPYVCCMMVFWGMYFHFGSTFTAFANRYSRGSIPTSTLSEGPKMSWVARALIAASALGLCCLVAAYFARPDSYSRNQIDWGEIKKLPVQHEGRIKSFDSVARNVLQYISKPIFGNVPYVKDAQGNKHEPSEWLLGVMAGRDWVREAQVFRIYAPEVRGFMDLEKRKGYRYSYAELEPKLDDFRAEIAPLRQKHPDDFDHREQKFAALHSKLNLFDLLSLSYREPPLPQIRGDENQQEINQIISQLASVGQFMEMLESGNPPAMIPPPGEASERNLVDAKWQAYGPASFADLRQQSTGQPGNEAIPGFSAILRGVAESDAPEVNKAVRKYHTTLENMPLAAVKLNKAAAESWLNQFNPTAQGVLLYLLAIAMAFTSFLVRWDGLRRATFWLLVGVFVIHTIALISRIYISGRAPVINLYSSAVFIGWACVLLCLVLERIYPIGIANLVGAQIGVATIAVARFLDTSDTLPVLQAVLDTQFWLSTHVITITAGYAVTFAAGFIGMAALVHRMATGYDACPPGARPKESEAFQQILYRMCYGVVCFAIFFSFIGTVLGGLWADDSWGRFWGWDPKENGAMMIVLWNAILLHARWDKQVGPRGFAVLAVLGNVVTTWSWFGTNQLGIGLHSYGFTSGALIGLMSFIGVNLLFVMVALIVTRSMAVGANRKVSTS